MLTQDRLKEILHYDPETGEFRWRARLLIHFKNGGHSAEHNCAKWNSNHSGKIAGTIAAGNYRSIKVDGRLYRAHRLAWLYMIGEWPMGDIDHINLTRDDNVFVNLREATRSQNNANTGLSKSNTSGIKGVGWHKKNNKWRANIQINGRNAHLGLFAASKDAQKAHQDAAIAHYGEFARFK